jgi:hypothetical protein
MLSHAKTEMDVVKELASDDKAYRSLTLSWFKNSPLLEIIQHKMGFKLILTTDHGTINVKIRLKSWAIKTPASICATKQGAA